MIGLYGNGFHLFMLDEAELGKRVAMFLDSESTMGWTALDDLIYLRSQT